MPTDNPLLNYFILYVPVLVVLAVGIWATYVKEWAVPGATHKEVKERCARLEAALDASGNNARAIEILAEQLRRSEARGDEFKDLLRVATTTAQRAATVAEVAQKQNSTGTGG
jgi:hypothetical protein